LRNLQKSRTEIQKELKRVTGPVSIPFTGFVVSD